ncbi:response regulator [Psychroflexus sp. YR1-1]|uniref:Response regulator n=1 Tax=Psychroflexus aurantiacus TaxID=2709310 RepID=A0A6B3R278_9FLAO|nr:response regulator [Psychroflexus aurantiacus]NEV94766.1 response regulator [Psychroflexus aurantiacus]
MAIYNKLFIVDDDELFVVIAKHLLQELDFAEIVMEFPDGEDAFEFFNENDPSQYPDIIILDINMKRMDGWEFLNAIRPLNIPKDIKIYITSSSIDPADLEKAKADPYVDSFISKPLSAEKLKEIARDKK